MKWIVRSIFLFMFLTATFAVPHSAFSTSNELKNIEPFIVRHYIKGNNVFIECMIENFSFRQNEKSSVQTGKMLVYIDGKKYAEMTSAAFILKDIKSGKHHIQLQLVKMNGENTSLKKEFIISIP